MTQQTNTQEERVEEYSIMHQLVPRACIPQSLSELCLDLLSSPAFVGVPSICSPELVSVLSFHPDQCEP